ncbi:hypothetical protein BRC73_01240 [Halobacteriales archaeon QH_7_66_37]|nr:MAG: hypothetical protein BRC73_01240 [Halobacteriales archaeon QH_7_66_37]
MTDTDGWLPVVIPAVLTSFVLGLGGQRQQRPAPQAGFEFDYDDAAGTVTITHTAGDTIRADPGARIDLVWEGTNRTVTLGTFTVPG